MRRTLCKTKKPRDLTYGASLDTGAYHKSGYLLMLSYFIDWKEATHHDRFRNTLVIQRVKIFN